MFKTYLSKKFKNHKSIKNFKSECWALISNNKINSQHFPTNILIKGLLEF